MNKLLIFTLLLLISLASCKTPEARRPVSVKTGSFIDVSVERNKKLNAKEEASIKKLMAQEKKDYIASESGFWYYYNIKVETDSLKTPDFGDIVNFDYVVKALNGSIIYSEEDIKARSYAMDKEELFTGLREGLKLMKSGETVTFLFPSQKAYGYYGDQNKIGTNIPLICEVTVHSITENQSN
ncbi:gliding motility-associated peptidyl-prolyl isomerase GldI [Flavobacteriaceae bacterium XHP0103]|uniref:gliding motility-associated peptidyl-prolyl isomerase GldI n=1 Tax=Marixanthotalea marina TaxID=2844359 RepID=UPI002989CBD7|nr:gliding motility-associated peptidyl-prolyl isomerase GldI [Marixanthotalea marina]MBU3822617.1 gliding motility-associated peptidyl-prolyl isomerase GldI [Marixanthotalea marina]